MLLWRSANARNLSFRNSLRWPIYIINVIELHYKTKLSCGALTDAAPLFLWKRAPLIQLLKGGHVYWHIVRYFTVAPPNTGRVPPSRRYLMVKIKGEAVRPITSPPWSSICSSLRISKTTQSPCRLCTETPPRRLCSSTTSVNLDKTNNGNMVYWNLHNSNIRLSFVKRMKKRKAQRTRV